MRAAEGVVAVKYRGVFGTIITMVRTEGARSLYSGLVAGLQRQMSFASVRIGLYDSVKQFYTKGSERECCVRAVYSTVLLCSSSLTMGDLGVQKIIRINRLCWKNKQNCYNLCISLCIYLCISCMLIKCAPSLNKP